MHNYEVHDGYLDGILVEGNRVNLHIANGLQRTVLVLEDVMYFRADSFLMGNIILDASATKVGEVVDITLKLGRSIEDGYINDVLLQKALEENGLYFELNSSYGCSIQAICLRIS